jgi:hypothetical protein
MSARWLMLMLSLLFASATWAAGQGAMGMGGQGEDAQFQRLDANSDGVISQDEAAGHQGLVDHWKSVDKDESGTIDQSEFSAFEQMQQGAPAKGEKSPSGRY